LCYAQREFKSPPRRFTVSLKYWEYILNLAISGCRTIHYDFKVQIPLNHVNFRTKQFLRKRFADYYENSHLILPHDFPRREWGFIFFDELPDVVMRRHKAFSRENEALDYIRGMVPAHAYHSAAYYEFPGAATMKEKKWQGADLIFDLDADHLPGKVYSYKEMLDNVKSETEKLLFDFLLGDFGFSEDEISIVFSGGRGYHIHVRDLSEKVIKMESGERREIVDYLSGTELKTKYIFEEEKRIITGKFKRTEIVSPRRVTNSSSGWGKRIINYLIHFLREISIKDDDTALTEIVKLIKNYHLKKANKKNIPENVSKYVIQMRKENFKLDEIVNETGTSKEMVREILIMNDLWDLRTESIVKLKYLKKYVITPKGFDMIEKGMIDFPNITYIFDAIIEQAIEEKSVHLGSAQTDEPVTADIKRLIRMPNSLHGGSGMRVVPLKLSEFEKFEPLRDAIVFREKEIEIEVGTPLKPQFSNIEMKGEEPIPITEGSNTIPEYAAIYLMCRGAAEYA
jgi:DNA primase small subunit